MMISMSQFCELSAITDIIENKAWQTFVELLQLNNHFVDRSLDQMALKNNHYLCFI